MRLRIKIENFLKLANATAFYAVRVNEPLNAVEKRSELEKSLS